MPSAFHRTLGKKALCRMPRKIHTAKIYTAKIQDLAKIVLGPSVRVKALGKDGCLQRVSKAKALGKIAITVTRPSLGRHQAVSCIFYAENLLAKDKRHLAKSYLPFKTQPSELCQGWHSTKSLPSVFGSLPSAAGTQQITCSRSDTVWDNISGTNYLTIRSKNLMQPRISQCKIDASTTNTHVIPRFAHLARHIYTQKHYSKTNSMQAILTEEILPKIQYPDWTLGRQRLGAIGKGNFAPEHSTMLIFAGGHYSIWLLLLDTL